MQELEGGWFLTIFIVWVIWLCGKVFEGLDSDNKRRLAVLEVLDLRAPHVIEMEKKRGAAVLTVVDSRPPCVIEEETEGIS